MLLSHHSPHSIHSHHSVHPHHSIPHFFLPSLEHIYSYSLCVPCLLQSCYPCPSFHSFRSCHHLTSSVASSYPSSYPELRYLLHSHHWLNHHLPNQTCRTMIQVIHWGKYTSSA